MARQMIFSLLHYRTRKEALSELQAWANTVRNPATSFRCEEIADGIEAALEKLK